MTNKENYYSYADKACQYEKTKHWVPAMECWSQAAQLAKKNVNAAWAQTRIEFCEIRYERETNTD